MERQQARGVGGPECLKARAREIEAEAAFLRRHEELIDWAVEELGLDRERAEGIYEIAREEDVEPAYVLELVRCGVGVGPKPPQSHAPSLETSAPAWVANAPDPEGAQAEWRLRVTVRRLRSLLEESDSVPAALRAFAAEPDIVAIRY